ncbi:MAG: hypothetical protein LBF71_05385 [Campylobacteraceae bacterium]|jgi:hypothetical protein|nr:hypothetical protein [Campylobacteraceae bacterium]
MNTIKFSHNYLKLFGQTRADLIAVRTLFLPKDLNPTLEDYDTTFLDKKGFKDKYELGKGEHLQLVFIGNYHIPFCTIRSRWGKNGDKKAYYESKIKQRFEIIIEGGNKK